VSKPVRAQVKSELITDRSENGSTNWILAGDGRNFDLPDARRGSPHHWVGTTTLARWMRNPQFQAEYRETRNAAVSQASARIQQSSGAAAATIVKSNLERRREGLDSDRGWNASSDHELGT